MVGVTPAELAAREFAALGAMIREEHPRPGDTRTCPDCGHPQHYTGTEYGWAHDARVDTWLCEILWAPPAAAAGIDPPDWSDDE